MAPRHILPTLAAGVLVFGVAACGDDSNVADQPPDPTDTTVPPDTTAPTDDTVAPTTASPSTVAPTTAPPTTQAGADFEHPTGADEVVVEIAHEGGFLPADMVFSQLPTLLVSGDGRQFTLGPQIAIYPPPLLPNVLVSDVGEAGIQDLLALAADHGLLTERDYERDNNIADAPDTVVRISANGETYEHRAYALGMDDDETGARAELQAFVEAATSDVAPDGAMFEPENYLLRATPIEDTSVFDVEPTIVDWPADSSLSLADADDCVEVPTESVHDLFVDANQLTFFVQDGVTYQLAVKPQLPGDSC